MFSKDIKTKFKKKITKESKKGLATKFATVKSLGKKAQEPYYSLERASLRYIQPKMKI